MFKMILLSTRDNKEWHDVINRFALKDVHYLPEYLAIYETESNIDSFTYFGGQAFLFVYGDSKNFIVYPFFKRSISYLPFANDSVKDAYDIVSPYGYGGPLAQLENEKLYEELWRGFFQNFNGFCQENKIVSEFCRLHPIYENHKPISKFSGYDIELMGPIVYIDLNYSGEDILANMIHGHRRHIQAISKNRDFSFCTDRQTGHSKCFHEIYIETMQRLKADNKYFFSRDFFDKAFQALGNYLNFWSITYKGDIVSGWLILKYGDQAYCWLSGTRNDYLQLASNHLLVYESILQLKQEGFKYMIMGGGRSTEKDSLFYFKSGFSKLTRDFHIYKKIHLPEEYDRLVKLHGYAEGNNIRFFPLYRLSGKGPVIQNPVNSSSTKLS